jgi:CRP/FNR family cyclic AMP-dependent transcriptional regulator
MLAYKIEKTVGSFHLAEGVLRKCAILNRWMFSACLHFATGTVSYRISMPLPTRLRRVQEAITIFDAKAFLANAGIGRTRRHYRPKQNIFSQGERADSVLFIQEGRVRLSVISRFGKEATIALFGRDHFLGQGCLASDQPFRLATATAVSNCSVLRIEKSDMLRTLHEEHLFSDIFVDYLVKSHNRTEADLVDQLFNSSEKRLARALLTLASFGTEGKPEAIIPSVSQKTLAQMIGTTRQRVNFFMNRFRKLRHIKYKRGSRGGLQVNSSLLSVVLQE